MQIFSPGQVAKICEVAPRTVANWCDTGLLKCFRIPGSRHRRIPRENLEAFFEQHDMEYARPALEKMVEETV